MVAVAGAAAGAAGAAGPDVLGAGTRAAGEAAGIGPATGVLRSWATSLSSSSMRDLEDKRWQGAPVRGRPKEAEKVGVR